jgi:hypothetical protein
MPAGLPLPLGVPLAPAAAAAVLPTMPPMLQAASLLPGRPFGAAAPFPHAMMALQNLSQQAQLAAPGTLANLPAAPPRLAGGIGNAIDMFLMAEARSKSEETKPAGLDATLAPSSAATSAAEGAVAPAPPPAAPAAGESMAVPGVPVDPVQWREILASAIRTVGQTVPVDLRNPDVQLRLAQQLRAQGVHPTTIQTMLPGASSAAAAADPALGLGLGMGLSPLAPGPEMPQLVCTLWFKVQGAAHC